MRLDKNVGPVEEEEEAGASMSRTQGLSAVFIGKSELLGCPRSQDFWRPGASREGCKRR
jgi:hypothetical protein